MRASRLITVVDAHAEGETGKVVTGGVPDVPGLTMLEKALHLERHGDWLRRFLLTEPRGMAASCANLVLPPTRPEADMGFIIMESMGYPAMSGSNAMCTATVLLETGMVPMEEPETRLVLEAPGGLVTARVGPHAAVHTAIGGRAWISGLHHYLLDPDDPFPEGFTLPDVWPGEGYPMVWPAEPGQNTSRKLARPRSASRKSVRLRLLPPNRHSRRMEVGTRARWEFSA